MSEKWLPAVGYEGLYEISDFGQARSAIDRKNTFNKKVLKQWTCTNGYQSIRMYKNGKGHPTTIHSLVMAAFIGPRPEGYQINHKDGNKANNHVSNLEYITPLENVRHAHRTGLSSQNGENNVRNKLTEENVHEIRRLRGKETQKSMAARLGVCQATITHIATGRNWSWLKEEEDDNVEQ